MPHKSNTKKWAELEGANLQREQLAWTAGIPIGRWLKPVDVALDSVRRSRLRLAAHLHCAPQLANVYPGEPPGLGRNSCRLRRARCDAGPPPQKPSARRPRREAGATARRNQHEKVDTEGREGTTELSDALIRPRRGWHDGHHMRASLLATIRVSDHIAVPRAPAHRVSDNERSCECAWTVKRVCDGRMGSSALANFGYSELSLMFRYRP